MKNQIELEIESLEVQLEELNKEIDKERLETYADDDNPVLSDLMDKKGLIEKHIQELKEKLIHADANIKKNKTYKVKIGGKDIKTFTVINGEADMSRGLISKDSPLAQALTGKKSGDKVEVTTPLGTVEYKILEII
jgi:transcription elongation factor GreA